MPRALYIHIPFCISKCLYCDFYSIPIEEDTARRYASALASEIRSCPKDELETVYIGGGTPTVMPEDSLREIFTAVTENFTLAPDAEITIEANPGTVDKPRAQFLRALGINRISIGVQSFHDEELHQLGRTHTAAQAEAAVRELREVFDNLSLDLIYSVPGQSMDSLRRSVEHAVSLDPAHVSAYELTPEPGTPLMDALARGVLALPEEDEAVKMAKLVRDMLAHSGYARYEVSNFARPGRECRHNITYWLRGEYFGCGASAHSFIKGRREKNVADVTRYIELGEQGKRPLEESIEVTCGEALREHVFLGLRLTRGLDVAWFRDELALDLMGAAGTLIDDGFMEFIGGRLRLTEQGMMLFNPVVAAFLEALKL
jgi:oxygen-independent coproporphyrinogen-3 oxidase